MVGTSGRDHIYLRLNVIQRLLAGFAAAIPAIAVNTIVLKIASLFSINPSSGGLFALLRLHLGSTFEAIGFASLWAAMHLPMPGTLVFWILFHTFIGLVMAVLYAYFIEPLLSTPGWVKGALFSLLPWIVNSAVVMPLLGKGFAASAVLSFTGMVYYFFANASYAVLLGFFYEKFARSKG